MVSFLYIEYVCHTVSHLEFLKEYLYHAAVEGPVFKLTLGQFAKRLNNFNVQPSSPPFWNHFRPFGGCAHLSSHPIPKT